MKTSNLYDYSKAKLTFWRPKPPQLHAAELVQGPQLEPQLEPAPKLAHEVERAPQQHSAWPWRPLAALVVALAGQFAFEPPERALKQGLVLYTVALILLVWAIWRGEWPLVSWHSVGEERVDQLSKRHYDALFLGAPLALTTFLFFRDDYFTFSNIFFWLLTTATFVYAFWLPSPQTDPWWSRLWAFLACRQWGTFFSRWTLILLAAASLVIFFRFYRLNQVPAEMISDHAEKLLDVYDVMLGKTLVFFPRNTGREAFQMYLTVAVILLFGTGFSFLSLKIGTCLAGLLTLLYIYLLGKEIGNRQVGLLAMVFAGIAYWPNVITRIALRFTLYPFFTAAVLYYLIRGLQTRNRNSFIFSGIALGLGLHGYTAMRIVPLVVVIAVGLYSFSKQSAGRRKQALVGLVIVSLLSLIVFLPLLGYTLQHPEIVSFRAMTRLGSLERDLPGPVWQIFFENLWNAVTMFAWDNGQIWVHSVPGRPALDIVSAAVFHLGVVLLLVRYLRCRHWLDLFLVLAVPLLMMPSILSLAFPEEHPALNRSGAAFIPVFLTVGITLDGLLTALTSRISLKSGPRLARGLIILLVVAAAVQNYDLVFRQYHRVYQSSSWNSSEIGRVIHNVADSQGHTDNVWVVAYPHWVDTRLVGINAGYLPTWSNSVWPDQIKDTLSESGAKMFVLNVNDEDGLQALHNSYPQGTLQRYESQVETKDFHLYFVPSEGQPR
jgi:hypothetical protein